MPYITTHFKTEEFTCPCCQRGGIDPLLVKMVLQKIRDRFRKPCIISQGGGVRCRDYNIRIRHCASCKLDYHGMRCPSCCSPGSQRSARWSRHMMGTEADVVVIGVEPDVVADYAETIQQVRNVGRYWTFTHIGIGGNSSHRWDVRKK